MMMQTIRTGLVGLGKIARDQHVPAILADPAFALVATASPDGALAGVPAFPDLDSLLASSIALDAVVLCTPPAVRAGLAAQAIAAGLHVMLEKPPALTAVEAEPLAAAAGRQGISLFATWHSREGAGVADAAEWLSRRRIQDVRVIWRESIDRWHPGQDWLLSAGGFGVFDPAINAFSILTRILPAPLEVTAADLHVPANRFAAAEAMVAMLCGDATVRCDLSILERGAQCWDITVRTDGGELVLSEGGHALAIDGVPRALAPAGEYPRLYRQFAALIAAHRIDVDLAPLRLVDAAMQRGIVHPLPPFHFA